MRSCVLTYLSRAYPEVVFGPAPNSSHRKSHEQDNIGSPPNFPIDVGLDGRRPQECRTATSEVPGEPPDEYLIVAPCVLAATASSVGFPDRRLRYWFNMLFAVVDQSIVSFVRGGPHTKIIDDWVNPLGMDTTFIPWGNLTERPATAPC